MESIPDPDIEEGIEYWKTQPASLDGVLGELKRVPKPRSRLTADAQEGLVLGYQRYHLPSETLHLIII
jgi:hypothetical protein